MPKRILLVVLAVMALSCDSSTVWSESQSLQGGFWNKDQPLEFTIPVLDSTQSYNIFLNLRNSNDYKYNNLYVIIDLQHPFGKNITDTLEYRMAYPNGEWMGEGIGSVKENKLWYKEGFKFTENGAYTVQITHAVRNNGEADGVSNLEGITDVGFSIEVADQQ